MTEPPKKKREYNFKPGVSGNPLGGKLKNDLTVIQKELRKQLVPRMLEISAMNQDTLIALQNNANTSVYEAAIIKFFQEMAAKGCERRLALFLDRVIGRPKEAITMDVKDPDGKLAHLSNEELANKLAQARLMVLAQKSDEDVIDVESQISPDGSK